MLNRNIPIIRAESSYNKIMFDINPLKLNKTEIAIFFSNSS